MIFAVHENYLKQYQIGDILVDERNERRLLVGFFNIPCDAFSDPYLVTVDEKGLPTYLDFMNRSGISLEGPFDLPAMGEQPARNFVENFRTRSKGHGIEVTAAYNPTSSAIRIVDRKKMAGGIAELLEAASDEIQLGKAFTFHGTHHHVNGRILGINDKGPTVFVTMHDLDRSQASTVFRHRIVDVADVVPMRNDATLAERGALLTAEYA